MTAIRGPRQIDITDMLNSRLRSNPTWVSLFGAVNKVLNENITEPRRQLASIRDPILYHRGDWVDLGDGNSAIINQMAVQTDGSIKGYAQVAGSGDAIEFNLASNLKDRNVLVSGAQRHGFHYFSDTLSDDDYARINRYIERYWPESGTENFVRFIGFVKNMYLDIDQLWSKENTVADEYPFLEPYSVNDGVPVWVGGDYYPTSHVQLRYDAVLNGSNIDYIDLFYLFYYLAPIHLVLERIVGEITATVNINRAVALAINGYSTGRLDYMNINATATRQVNFGLGSVLECASGVLVLDADLQQAFSVPV